MKKEIETQTVATQTPRKLSQEAEYEEQIEEMQMQYNESQQLHQETLESAI